MTNLRIYNGFHMSTTLTLLLKRKHYSLMIFLLSALLLSPIFASEKTEYVNELAFSPLTEFGKIEYYRNNNQLAAAKSIAIEHLKKQPNDVDVLLSLGLIYYQESNYMLAEYYLLKVINKSPDNLDAKIDLVRVKIAQNKDKEVAPLLAQISDNASERPEIKELQELYQKSLKNKLSKKPNPDIPILEKIKFLMKNKKLNQAEQVAKNYLLDHHKDYDVKLYLGIIYYQKNNYVKAKYYFNDVIKNVPTYVDAKLGLIRVAIAENDLQKAKTLIEEVKKEAPNNTELKEIIKMYQKIKSSKKVRTKTSVQTSIKQQYLTLINREIELGRLTSAQNIIDIQLTPAPTSYDLDLLLAEAKIFFKKHLYGQSAYICNEIMSFDPNHKGAKELLSTIKEIRPHAVFGLNEIGISTFNQRVPDLNATWNFATLYYVRETFLGLFFARLNYARRLGERAPQGELEFLPVITPNLYLDLYGSYANKPELYPHYSLSFEPYWTIPNFLTFSGGPYFAYIIDSTFYKKYTFSISKSLEKYWLSIRANHYVPNAGDESTLYMATIRRYFYTYDFFVNLTLGTGTSPDLSDLQTLDFIVIKNKFGNLSLRFPISDYRFLADIGIDIQHWKYPSGLIRNLYGVNVGLNYRF